jgi:hypothetical protein
MIEEDKNMMLICLFVFILLIGISFVKIGEHYWDPKKHKILYDHDEFFEVVGWVMAWLGGIATVFCLIFSLINCIGCNTSITKQEETYKAIVYKIESGACRDEFGLLNKATIDEVQHWNEELAFYKKAQNDFWIGMFYPNIYDDLQFIDYRDYNTQ